MESVKKQEPFQLTLSKKEEKLRRRKKIIAGIKTNKFLYVMILPGVLYFLIFRYLPMGGLVIAFQDYQPFLGIMGSPWVGFKHFIRLFTEPTFFTLLRNTLILFGLNIFVFFPMPIILSLLLPVVLVNFNILKNISKFLQNVVVLDLIEHCKPVICFQIYSLAL